ncbi:MAG: DUF4163 domain-containing protein [Cyclobacteriaceae bacterium]
MRHNLSQTVLFILLILTACVDSKKEKEKPNKDTKTGINTSFENSKFELLESNCGENDCSKVTISYPSFNGNSPFAERLNDQIQTAIQSQISNYVMKASKSESIETLAAKFIQGYEDFTKEFPEVKSKWYVDILCEMTHQHQDFVSLKITTVSYTGGAHANTEVAFNNYNSSAEEVNDLSFFFYDEEQLKVTAEKEFRSLLKMSEEKSLADAGYIFDNNSFTLPEEFGFNNQGLVLFYNNYEIGSYSEGFIDLIIPYTVLGTNYRFNK